MSSSFLESQMYSHKIGATLLAAFIFYLDSLIPLGVAIGIPYIFCILIAYKSPNSNTLWQMVLLTSTLTIIGLFISPSGGELWKTLANRGQAILAIVITAIILSKQKSEYAKYLTSEKKIIEDQKEKEKQQLIIAERDSSINEIHHRIKNNLQVIVAIMGLKNEKLQSNKCTELYEFTQNRIESIALVHELLYKSPGDNTIDFKQYIELLLPKIASVAGAVDSNVKFDIDVQPLWVESKKCVTLGMILNELVSNSFKHAFTNQESGIVKVIVEKKAADNFTLIYEDNGNLKDQDLDGDTESLGLKLVANLVKQLNGNLDVDLSSNTRFIIDIPDEETINYV